MIFFGHFTSSQWGRVTVTVGTYASGGLAVRLEDSEGMPLTTLSVRLEGPAPMPPRFWAKTWSENETLAREALASGLFTAVGPTRAAGFAVAELWEIVEPPLGAVGRKEGMA